ncbi:MAG: hypothetical protein RID09_21670 [Coleofasciculus sp. G1-WW12-02]|uniref:hypothetical protein n=1 Tax=Coleofasciculus sp. G1-WW12-02 TaxID=3068483 RepID=UPI0032F3C5E5
MLTQKIYQRKISNSFDFSQLFAQSMQKGKISLADWYELLVMPMDNTFTSDHEEAVTRLIYGVRHGFVKVVDNG